MRSNFRPSHQAAGFEASPTVTRAARPNRVRLDWEGRDAVRVAVEREDFDAIGAAFE